MSEIHRLDVEVETYCYVSKCPAFANGVKYIKVASLEGDALLLFFEMVEGDAGDDVSK